MRFRILTVMAAALALIATAATAADGGRFYKSGTVILKQGQVYDFDYGRSREWGADVQLAGGDLNPTVLKPKFATKLGYMGKRRPDFRRCNRFARSSSPIKVSMLKKRTHVCIRTTRGFVGYLTVIAPYNPRESAMGLRFRLWQKPQCCAIAGGFYRVDRGKCAREGRPVPSEKCK